MAESTFVLRSEAADFVTRDIGKRLCERLLALDASVRREALITIDATGITMMSPSFVDEFFGRIAAKLGIERFRSRIRMIGVDDELKPLINNVVRNRLLLERSASPDVPAANVEL